MIALRAPSIPLVDAPELAPAVRRTLLVRLGLAAALAALLAACLLVARGLRPQPSSYFAGGGSGVLVLDFSTSIDPSRYRRIARILDTFVRTSQPMGLVAYSDVAYDAVPLGTRGEALKPLLRFFELPPGDLGAIRPAGRGQDFYGYPLSPWSGSFRGGTRISRGLSVARQMLERQGLERTGSVVLVSDLDDSPFDTTALTDEAIRYQREGIRLRLVPLTPSPEDREMFVRLAGRGAFFSNRELLANSALEESRTLVGSFPVSLVLAAAGLLLLLALNERACGRLSWRPT